MTERFDDWSTTAASNAAVGTGNVSIAEGMAPGNVNDAMREIMASAALSFGGFAEGTSRPSIVAANTMWLDTTTATAPIVKLFDGTDDITVMTFNYTANTVAFSAFDIVSDTTPQLGGNLDVNGKEINSASNGNIVINPNGTGDIDLACDTVLVEQDIVHDGDLNNKIAFGTDTQSYETGGTARLDLSDSGVRLGAANARVTTVLDEDAMSSDSATALATQQSIKAYADTKGIVPKTVDTTTGGTTIDFTSIAAGANRVTMIIAGLSLSGTSDFLVQIGDSGGFETTVYVSTAGHVGGGDGTSTTGFRLTASVAASQAWTGRIVMDRLTSNTWVCSSVIAPSDNPADSVAMSGGRKGLSGELTQVRLTTVNGSDTFDANTGVNIFVE